MGMVDQMKYAKILYLADVLEDISAEMVKRTYHNKDLGKNILDIVADLRGTIAGPVSVSPMTDEKIEIRRLEHSVVQDPLWYLPIAEEERERFYNRHCRMVVNDLLEDIRKSGVVRFTVSRDTLNREVFTASLIVGIEKDYGIVHEEPGATFLEKLAKYLDEENHL